MTLPFRFLRASRVALSLLALAAAPWAAAVGRVQITVLSTTDLHAHILPVDYTTNRPEPAGLARVATLVAQARKAQPNLLLIDCGDTIQGTPLGYFHARRNNAPSDPMMRVMGAMGYDAMTVGNHEYNFGLPVLEKARGEAAFPWLSANTCRAGTDEPAYPPHLVREIDGVRVAVLGLTTPGVPVWEDPPNYAGLEFRDPVDAARKWVDVLRGRERADVVVAAVHMGLEENLATGEAEAGIVPHENAALALARSVPGIDVIFMGHTHREVSSLLVNGVLLAQAGRWGECLARADIYLEPDANGRWAVVAKASRTIPVTAEVEVDPAVAALAAPYDRETQAWLGRAIGTCPAPLSAAESRFRDTAILDLVNRAQMEAGEADVSMAASFNPEARLPQGEVTVRDIAGLYVYENTLVVVEVTGAQLKEALEHAARYFRDYEPGRTAADLVDPRARGYNFDIAAGVDYTIDLRRPAGDRIVDLRFRGAPLDPQRKLRLAINNYRHNGGGGYSMYREAPVLQRSSAEIRDVIIDWVEKNGEVPAEPDNNWRLVVE